MRAIQRVTESTGSYADPASPSAGSSQRESETKETAQLFRSPLKYLGLFPIARRYCAHSDLSGWVRHRSHRWRGRGRLAGML
jgi:hypothetical protein